MGVCIVIVIIIVMFKIFNEYMTVIGPELGRQEAARRVRHTL